MITALKHEALSNLEAQSTALEHLQARIDALKAENSVLKEVNREVLRSNAVLMGEMSEALGLVSSVYNEKQGISKELLLFTERFGLSGLSLERLSALEAQSSGLIDEIKEVSRGSLRT